MAEFTNHRQPNQNQTDFTTTSSIPLRRRGGPAQRDRGGFLFRACPVTAHKGRWALPSPIGPYQWLLPSSLRPLCSLRPSVNLPLFSFLLWPRPPRNFKLKKAAPFQNPNLATSAPLRDTPLLFPQPQSASIRVHPRFSSPLSTHQPSTHQPFHPSLSRRSSIPRLRDEDEAGCIHPSALLMPPINKAPRSVQLRDAPTGYQITYSLPQGCSNKTPANNAIKLSVEGSGIAVMLILSIANPCEEPDPDPRVDRQISWNSS